MTSRAVVLVFTHKPGLEWFEAISLVQCYKILGRHPIRLVCPAGMDTSAYEALVPNIQIDGIPPRWLSSLGNYNRLKVKPFLYKRYADFEFMLTYELDAFVFRDDLNAWCDEGWDYIGAPWFENYDLAIQNAKPLGVGNSGFSLRRTRTMLKISQSLRYQRPPREVVGRWLSGEYRFKSVISSLTYRNNFYGPLNNFPGHEDRFWCEVAAPRFPEFRLAPVDVASRFAFEANPSRLFREAGERLPFGCHKWMQHETEFWRPHIEQFGYRLPADVTRPAEGAGAMAVAIPRTPLGFQE
jgi:hypothetical protein